MTDSYSSGRRIFDLFVEALMVVFAVMVALGVEEWREERQLHEFADRARSAVEAEIRANVEELRSTRDSLEIRQQVMFEVIQRQDLEPLHGDQSLMLPDFSTAAWRMAQVSPAASYLDYDWMIRVSRAYEASEVYSRVSADLIRVMSGLLGQAPTVEGVTETFGHLAVLVGIHVQLEEALADLLPEEGS